MRNLAPVALLLAACTGAVDYPSNLHDLRIVAMRSEPPEAVVGMSPQLPTFHLEALVLDPAGQGRALHYAFRACPFNNLRCEGGSGAIDLAQGDVVDNIAATDFSPSLDFIQAAQKNDPASILFGAYLMVSLKVTTDDGAELVSGKRVVLSLDRGSPMFKQATKLQLPSQTANKNPLEPVLLLGEKPDGTPVAGGDRPAVAVSPAPTFDVKDAQDREEYTVIKYDLTTLGPLLESFDYTWYTTKGHFTPFGSGGRVQGDPKDQPTKTTLDLQGEEPGDFDIYVVVRDGRGGETWIRRAGRLGQ